MDAERANVLKTQKKSRPIEREMNTALFLLRCVQIGLSVSDLRLLTFGMVLDLMTEADNDNCEYKQLATQADFDAFKGKNNGRQD